MIVQLGGPISGKDHDGKLLKETKMEEIMLKVHDDTHVPYALYGDKGYRMRLWLLRPYKGMMSQVQQRINNIMSSVRVSVEHAFGRVQNLFPHVMDARSMKIYQQPVAQMMRIAVLFTNISNIYRPNQVCNLWTVPRFDDMYSPN